MNLNFCFAGALFCFLLLGGCATSRSLVNIPHPASATVSQPNGKQVFINSMVDKPIFETSPSSPSTPSLDPSEDQSDSIKHRSIGRKRNTFGKALGDIVLKEGQNIESLTSTSVRQAFIEKGYQVVDSSDKVSSNTYIVDADVEKFWSWMTPGFFALTLNTEISTNLIIKSPDGMNKQAIAVQASGDYQTGTEDNWIEVINKALRSYIDNLKAKLD